MTKHAPKTWSRKEEALLIKLKQTKGFDEVAKILGRSPGAVYIKYLRLRGKDVGRKLTRRPRACPQCGEEDIVGSSRCFNCDLRLHIIADCIGCGEWNEELHRCEAFKDNADPILADNGKCLGRKKERWEIIRF